VGQLTRMENSGPTRAVAGRQWVPSRLNTFQRKRRKEGNGEYPTKSTHQQRWAIMNHSWERTGWSIEKKKSLNHEGKMYKQQQQHRELKNIGKEEKGGERDMSFF